MARLTKETLKQLLKECLVEILQEQDVFLVKESKDVVAAKKTLQESGVVESAPQPASNPYLNESIKNLADGLSILDKSKKDIYQSIFEDTARTTLQDMIQNDMNYKGPVAPPTAEQKQRDEQTLQGLTGDGDLSRWAKVAFAGSSKK